MNSNFRILTLATSLAAASQFAVFSPSFAVASTVAPTTISTFNADPTTVAASDVHTHAVQRARSLQQRAVNYLVQNQRPDGTWTTPQEPPAITALVLRALIRDTSPTTHAEPVRRGFDALLADQRMDGGVYRDLLATYNTAIALSTMAAANDPAFAPHIERAVAYLRAMQWTVETRPEFQGDNETNTGQQVVTGIEDPFYGGWGYGGRSRGAGRPDLSNAQVAIEALHDAGIAADDPAMQRALTFLQRQQNWSETNDQPWASNDGGFVYGPSDDRSGESFAGESTAPDGSRILRSYGSMTYAGLKSYLYAGLTKDDPRVKAAWNWISDNFTFDENPGIGSINPEQRRWGLYYYFHTASRALDLYDQPVINTPEGTRDWRVALIDSLEKLQQPNGSFIGESKWMENNPTLVTSYVALALADILQDLHQHPVKP
jgi:squalene-hopene/tetraprenyl-beta-curcumene cyclase